MSQTNKETKTTLEGFSNEYGRMVGNSTRQVDLAIQLLFKGYIVKVLDHWENGEHRDANKDLFDRVLKRLHSEHGRIFYSRNIGVDRNELTIELHETKN